MPPCRPGGWRRDWTNRHNRNASIGNLPPRQFVAILGSPFGRTSVASPARVNQPGYFEDVDFIGLHDRLEAAWGDHRRTRLARPVLLMAMC